MPTIERSELENLMMVSRAVGLDHVDLGPALGADKAVLVAVADLRAALPRHDEQALQVLWDEAKMVELRQENGVVLGCFTVSF